MNQVEMILERIKNEKNITSGETFASAEGRSRIDFDLVNGQKHAVGYIDIGNEHVNVLIRESNYSPKYLKSKMNGILNVPSNYLFGGDLAIGDRIYLDVSGTDQSDYQVNKEYIIGEGTELFELEDGYRRCNSSSFLDNSVLAKFIEELSGPCINLAGHPTGDTLTLVFEIIKFV